MELTTKEELIAVITELQGQMANMQEVLDKMAPVVDEEATPAEGETEPEGDTEPTESVDEVDSLLQDN